MSGFLAAGDPDPLVPGLFDGVPSILVLAFSVLAVVAAWRVFAKAGYLGILAIVPVVNVFILVKIAGYSAWLTLLLLIPVVNVVFSIVVAVRVGRGFGRGGLWSFFLLWMLSVIGMLILGFDRSRYTRPE